MSCAITAASGPDAYELACDRYNRACLNYPRARAEAERIVRAADAEWEAAQAALSAFERSPGIPKAAAIRAARS